MVEIKSKSRFVKLLLYVFVGGGLGSVLRYLVSLAVGPESNFPWATMTANILSSFVLGLLVGLLQTTGTLSNEMRLMWVVGFCGGFSTFSTFSLENLQLWQSHQYGWLLLNILASVIVCMLCIFAGIKIVQNL